MRIKMVLGTVVGQQRRKPGDVVECPDADAKGLIATGQAVAAGDKAPKKEATDK
jgi:hypothetical protein